MNAASPIEAAMPRAAFERARDAAATWRGRCLDAFARSETAVTQTLLFLATVDKRGKSIKLPHLLGQRYDALWNAIGAGGEFAEEAGIAADALIKFKEHDTLRAQLAHGTFTVTLDHRGNWHLAARVLSLRAGRESSDLLVITESEASETLTAVERDGSRLRSTLGQFRQRLRQA
ncbi:hypothetical protein G7076_02950 [Sphingomonas sp. HDW15A]|uniref:hypothetical protein n=1 Tax=Sphingomonas sp. HDW15A TaxID=2714942 RepID=UPI00140E1D68|nr:hypothetical protein [Sphingomonas sp. HDW15A]QIK95574.1 hypothetical protein G7076_02950 [Sphingomonas sp. HDW15A]